MDSPNLARKTEDLVAINRKYKVLLVVRWPVGGIRTFLRYVYRNFDPELYQFTILAPDLQEMKFLLEDLKQLDVTYVPTEGKPSAFSFLKQSSKLILKNNFELIHSHGFTSGLCSLLPSLLSGIPHVLTVHDVLNGTQLEGCKGQLTKALLTLFLPLFTLVQSVSHDAQENLLTKIKILRYFTKKLIVIPNGIEVERFATDEKRNFREELNLPEGSFLIGFFGRFMSQKGFVYLVDALDVLVRENTSCRRPILLTFGAGGFIREEKDFIKSRGLEQHVYFMPFMANVAPSLRGIDVLAMPSLWEACGLVAMEAMVAGVPVIGTDCLGLREVLRDTPSVVVPARNSDALAWALREEMNESSAERAQAFCGEAMIRFDVRQQTLQLEALTRRLMEGAC